MKSQKGFKATGYASNTDDTIRKPAKLDPVRKSGKDRHSLYTSFEGDDDSGEEYEYRKRESVLDYFDDGSDEDNEL